MSKRENRKKKERLKKLEENYAFFEDRRKHVAFSFQFLTVGENAGQSFEDWNKEGIILDLNNKLREFSKKTKKESCYPPCASQRQPCPLNTIIPRNRKRISKFRVGRIFSIYS